MAKVIEFYVPARFQKPVRRVPQEQRRRVIEFQLSGGSRRNSARMLVLFKPRTVFCRRDYGTVIQKYYPCGD